MSIPCKRILYKHFEDIEVAEMGLNAEELDHRERKGHYKQMLKLEKAPNFLWTLRLKIFAV